MSEESTNIMDLTPTKPRVKTDDELRELAMAIYAGTVFTDRQLDDPRMIGAVFMPVGLGGLNPDDEPHMIYEHLDRAGPRSINGMPSFFSCQILNLADMQAFIPIWEQYVKLQDEFKGGES